MAGDARGRDGVAAVRERQRVAEPHMSDERRVVACLRLLL